MTSNALIKTFYLFLGCKPYYGQRHSREEGGVIPPPFPSLCLLTVSFDLKVQMLFGYIGLLVDSGFECDTVHIMLW